jgi:hypothetical protein
MANKAKNLNILTLESTKVKPVNLKFLYEFASIPLSVRKGYLNKLLTCRVSGGERKNAHSQKNVRLLKIIYEHINRNIMLQWDEGKICSELKISRNMMYCHKSWLLKGLRASYFKWNEPQNQKSLGSQESSLSLFNKAEEMFAIGMKREAKNIFLRLVSEIKRKSKKSRPDRFLLFNVLEYLCNYYMYSRKYREFTRHYYDIESVSKKLLKSFPEERARIITGLYLCRSYKINFYGNKTASTLESVQYLKSALGYAVKSRSISRHSHILCYLTGLLVALGRKEECIQYIRQGLDLAHRHNMGPPKMFFETLNDLAGLPLEQNGYQYLLNNIKSRFASLNLIPQQESFWKQKILFALTSLSTEIGTPLTTTLLYQYTSREIIYDGYDSSLRFMYFMKFDYYFARIKALRLRENCIVCKKADAHYLNKLNTAIFELIVNARKIRDVPFKKELYTFMLITDFWKGKNCNFEYSRNIMRHIDWLNKLNPGLKELNKEILDNTFLSITLISESRYLHKDTFLRKYETNVIRLARNILQMPESKALSSYYTLSFIAENTGYDELEEIARQTFFKLKRKYPRIIEHQIKQIKKQSYGTNQYELEEMAA